MTDFMCLNIDTCALCGVFMFVCMLCLYVCVYISSVCLGNICMYHYVYVCMCKCSCVCVEMRAFRVGGMHTS